MQLCSPSHHNREPEMQKAILFYGERHYTKQQHTMSVFDKFLIGYIVSKFFSWSLLQRQKLICHLLHQKVRQRNSVSTFLGF